MRTPGFTAERALSPAVGRRGDARRAAGGGRGRVVPQFCYQPSPEAPVTCVDCITVAGHHLCMMTTHRPILTHI